MEAERGGQGEKAAAKEAARKAEVAAAREKEVAACIR